SATKTENFFISCSFLVENATKMLRETLFLKLTRKAASRNRAKAETKLVYFNDGCAVKREIWGLMYDSVCKFGGERGDGEKMAFTFGRGQTIERWLRVRPRSFFDWENKEGVLPPELCDEHKQQEGTPMLLDQATPRNVSRALRE